MGISDDSQPGVCPGFSGIYALISAFQADDEDSIPFTRSNNFNDLDGRLLPMEEVGSVWETQFQYCKPHR